MPCALRPARLASSSCVSPAASRCCRSNSPKAGDPAKAFEASPRSMKSETLGQAFCADVRARLSRGRRDKRRALSDLEPAQLLTFSGQRHVTGQYGNLGCAHALTEFA